MTIWVTTPAASRWAVRGRSHSSIDPQQRHRKSREPQRMSWRAGMHGSEPVTWRVKRVARRAAKASRFGVANSSPP